MNIAEAIEIKQRYQYILQDASLPELIEADNLSIEALNIVKVYYPYFIREGVAPLSGETKE